MDGQYVNTLVRDSVDGDGVLLFHVSMVCMKGALTNL